MRPLSIVYVVLALLTLGMVSLAFGAMNSDPAFFGGSSPHPDNSDFVMCSHPEENLEIARMLSVFLVSLAGVVFGVTVFCGEAGRFIYAHIKKVPWLSARLSSVYVLLLLPTTGMVIMAEYCMVKGLAPRWLCGNRQIIAHSIDESGEVVPLWSSADYHTAVSNLLLLAMCSAVVFVVVAVVGEKHLRRSRVRTPNMDEEQKTLEEATTA